ncbi:MAG: NAD(P)/FAD-dependent oxidoreductase [Mongoliitalea sp.]
MWSYWEWKNFRKYDLVVVGAGIVGLSTAIQYKEKYPQRKVLVLERGLLPTGASTKNAGFACFGSLTELLDDLQVMNDDLVLATVEKRYKGLCAIRERFGDEALGYQRSGGFELFTDAEMPALDRMLEINQFLFPLFQADVFSKVGNIEQFGFGSSVRAVVKNQFEGELDTGKFIQSLWQEAQRLGVFILTGAEVAHINQEVGLLTVKEANGVERIFEAKQLAICTNAFTRKFLKHVQLVPGRGLVFVTKPLDNPLPWTGSFHYDKGYVYFRSIDNRILLGGGRNRDYSGEQTEDFEINPLIHDYLIKLLNEVILPNQPVEIDLEWTGIMAFGPTKMPIIEQINGRTFCAVRLGGMGVAIGWQTASELVDLL